MTMLIVKNKSDYLCNQETFVLKCYIEVLKIKIQTMLHILIRSNYIWDKTNMNF